MSAKQEYDDHIEALKKRIKALEISETNLIPKDLFMKLKFKEFNVGEGNYIEFVDNPQLSLNLNYEIDEI